MSIQEYIFFEEPLSNVYPFQETVYKTSRKEWVFLSIKLQTWGTEGNLYSVKQLMQFFCLGIEKHVLLLISIPLIKISEHNYIDYSLCLTFENVLLGSRSTSLESGELDLNLQLYCVSLGKLFNYNDSQFSLKKKLWLYLFPKLV